MTSDDIQKLLHILKPQGHGNSQFSTDLHAMANQIQRVFDLCFTTLTEVTAPTYKGDVVGELIPWPGHYPLELDHSGEFLNDILVRGVSVSEHLMGSLWDEALDYLEDCYAEPASDSETRTIKRMDAADLHNERTA